MGQLSDESVFGPRFVFQGVFSGGVLERRREVRAGSKQALATPNIGRPERIGTHWCMLMTLSLPKSGTVTQLAQTPAGVLGRVN